MSRFYNRSVRRWLYAGTGFDPDSLRHHDDGYRPPAEVAVLLGWPHAAVIEACRRGMLRYRLDDTGAVIAVQPAALSGPAVIDLLSD